MKLEDVINVWTSGRPETTTVRYQRIIARADRLARDVFKTELIALRTPQIEALIRTLSQGVTPRTQHLYVWIIKGFYRCVMTLGIRDDNPAAPLRAPRFEDTLAERLIRHEQVAAILAAAESERDKLFIQLLYGAGLRISEALHLSRKDILGDGRIKVFGKGGKTAYVRIRPELEQKLLAFAPADGRVFHPLTRKGAWRIVKRAATAAGLPKVSPHWFRHAHATEALRRGASLPLVRASLRHSSISTTMRYSHVVDGDGASLYLPPVDTE